MKKLHGIFLYCMLAFTPIYSMQMSYVFLSIVTGMMYPRVESYIKDHTLTADGKLNTHGISSLLSFFWVKTEFVLEKLSGGRYKSSETQKLDEHIKNIKRKYSLKRQKALLEQEQRLTREFKEKAKIKKQTLMKTIENKELENQKLQEEILSLKNQKEIQRSTDEWNKIQAEKDKKYAEEIARLNKKFQNSEINKRIRELEQEKQNLVKENADLKTKLEQRSMFTNIHNSFTLATQPTFNMSSNCPNCNSPLNEKLLLRE